MGRGNAPALPVSCLGGQWDTPVPPGVPRYSHRSAPQYRRASPSTSTMLTRVLPCVLLYPQYTVPSSAMHLPRLPPHHPPYRHVSPSASTIQSTVPPCCPHHPHYTVSSTITLPPASSPYRSLGPQAALLPPRIELGASGRLLTRTVPLSRPWAIPTPLRLNQAPVAGRFPSNLLQRRWRCSSFLPSCRLCHPRSNPRNHPRDCRNRAANRDPGAMGIPYRGLGLITLVGTTHDTSLWYAATRGRRAKLRISI